MAADVELTEHQGEHAGHAPATAVKGPSVQADPELRAMLSSSNGDPGMIASLMMRSGRSQDPKIWTAIQQSFGNAQAQKVRDALTQLSPATLPPVSAAAQTPLSIAAEPSSKIEVAPVSSDVFPLDTHRDVLGVRITAPAGVRTSSLEEVAQIVQTEIGKNAYAQQHFLQAKVQIIIIPAHSELTEVVDMSKVKDPKTFDGRDWSGVRGMGGTETSDGFTMAVAEESIVKVPGVKSAYPKSYSITMHELAHVLEAKGMDTTQQKKVKAMYDAHVKADPANAGGSFTDWYGAENEREYFAQSTNAFFDRNKMPTDPRFHSGREFLQQHDPAMYAFLVDLYDTNRDKNNKVQPAPAA